MSTPRQRWCSSGEQDADIELDRSRLFDKDMSEFRGKLRADLLAPNPASIVRVTGVTP